MKKKVREKKLDKNFPWNQVFICWLIATVATLGSLFFSEVMKFPPCVLCWYQRIAMYPLVALFLVALFRSEKSFFYYVLPLSFIGWSISIYHNLLYYKFLPESAAPCVAGISCTTVHIEWFGFITIPFLSFVAFSVINVILFLAQRRLVREK